MSDAPDTSAVLVGYVRRLLSPPLPGDGLLLFGFAEGLVGWPLTILFQSRPALAPIGLVPSIVALWALLTVGIVLVGVTYTAPVVRRKRVWVVWGVLNAAGIAVNALAVGGHLPARLAVYGYWHVWFLVFGVAYLVTAFANWRSPQLRRVERLVYAVAGVASFAALAHGVSDPAFGRHALLVGATLHLVPIGFDVAADGVLIARG